MKTYQKRKELHEKALQYIEMIEYAKRRKDAKYETYRNFSMITTMDEMRKTYQKLERWDIMISRLKEQYSKIIDELCILQ